MPCLQCGKDPGKDILHHLESFLLPFLISPVTIRFSLEARREQQARKIDSFWGFFHSFSLRSLYIDGKFGAFDEGLNTHSNNPWDVTEKHPSSRLRTFFLLIPFMRPLLFSCDTEGSWSDFTKQLRNLFFSLRTKFQFFFFLVNSRRFIPKKMSNFFGEKISFVLCIFRFIHQL